MTDPKNAGDTIGTPEAGASAQVRDTPECWAVTSSRRRFSGGIVAVRTDQVRMPGDDIAERDVVEHPGAVAALALDDLERVLLVRQYRHPVGHMLWEAPAGLRDVDGEKPWEAARRELYEEAGYRAQRWHTLVDAFTSPGASTERLRVYLARDLTEVTEGERFVGVHEETDMPLRWVPLDEAVTKVLAGVIHNPTAVMGILAAYAARADGFRALRSADAPEG